ncbi:MAG: RNB domain-containing ribonuclease, partial [Candidatus Dadabacteria bacterium]
MHNDRVVARVEGWHRREGRIVRILERASTRISGRIEITRTASFVRPKHRTVPFEFYVAPNDRGGARNGETVIAEVISYPTDKRPPACRVVKVLERPDEPRAEVEAIIEEFNLPHRFPRGVHEAAKELGGEIAVADAGRRKDLRHLPTVTIDGERARDFDDAVSVKITEHGYRLWVHIADVGFFVPWGSPIDMEARKRATSVYFPDRVIPMLPKELSEDLCSLRPKVERLAFTAEMDFSRDGERLNARFYPSLILSDERMTYTSVRKILVDQDRHERERYSRLLPDFELMNELCGVLRQRRLKRGSLDFDLPEPEVLLDLQGRPEAIVRAERNLAHMIIE